MKGGKRPGAGRKPGKKEPQTLEKERVLAALRNRIMQNADSLFNAAKSTAVGNSFLYRIDTTTEGKKTVRSKPILVTDPDEISDYIDAMAHGQEPGDDETYYFVTTKEPNVPAIKDLMDRAFGKPSESLELSGSVNLKLDE